ncbi:hypothetical protein KR215_002390 [Drosophila sulfurigaster]|uniref:uncharacterized protein LOC133843518 n=1 Tax=Drosophila sulfurigaster albostrigata TaxID=89887 RepID=UPI002D21E22F|nr:uncharacterized protein LOC133843518 [Drosophila sulfurigaster albostrigata]KAH8403763.1 hypothetical protein KR215_002390 [Drosophila sulfurigaster]
MEIKLILSQLLLISLVLLPPIDAADQLVEYQGSPKLSGPAKMIHDPQDTMLNALDAAMEKISTIYMQAVISGTHSPELEISLRGLEMELFDLLDELYKQHRLKDYMNYEAEVTRQMIIYNMLKRLFGYAQDNEKPV